jgi:hypothetical protein
MAVQVVLYQGEANPYSVKLRDPTVVGGSITAVGAWTLGGDAWAGAASETLSAAGSWTLGSDTMAGTAAEALRAAGSWTLGSDTMVGTGSQTAGVSTPGFRIVVVQKG